jgi:hypothetical protein
MQKGVPPEIQATLTTLETDSFAADVLVSHPRIQLLPMLNKISTNSKKRSSH